MNALTETYTFLSAALCDDPLLLLASAVAWLDPLWRQAGDDPDPEADALTCALHVTRRAFPDIYAEAVEHIWAGASAQQVDRRLCAAITRRGIPLDDLESMGYGIPLECYGAVLDNPDFHAQHPDLLPILALFGIHPEANGYSVDVPEAAYTVGRTLADSLLKQTDQAWRQVGWALAWLFSCSGNSMVDLDYESMAEIPPLSWEAEDIAFAIELIEEADGIMRDVAAGLKLLGTHPDCLTAMIDHVQVLYQVGVASRKRATTCLCWTPLTDITESCPRSHS